MRSLPEQSFEKGASTKSFLNDKKKRVNILLDYVIVKMKI